MASDEKRTLLAEPSEEDNMKQTSTERKRGRSSSPEYNQTTDPELHDVHVKHSNSTCTKESCFCVIVVFICVILLIGLMFGGGVVVGKYARDAESKGSKYNWGNDVTIGGHSVPVLNWFDGEMKTDNIKTNLEYVVLRCMCFGGLNFLLRLETGNLYTIYMGLYAGVGLGRG